MLHRYGQSDIARYVCQVASNLILNTNIVIYYPSASKKLDEANCNAVGRQNGRRSEHPYETPPRTYRVQSAVKMAVVPNIRNANPPKKGAVQSAVKMAVVPNKRPCRNPPPAWGAVGRQNGRRSERCRRLTKEVRRMTHGAVGRQNGRRSERMIGGLTPQGASVQSAVKMAVVPNSCQQEENPMARCSRPSKWPSFRTPYAITH